MTASMRTEYRQLALSPTQAVGGQMPIITLQSHCNLSAALTRTGHCGRCPGLTAVMFGSMPALAKAGIAKMQMGEM
jgi:hypothetical protein